MLVASEVAARPGVETVPTVEFDMPSVVMVAPDDGSQFAGRASPRCGCSEKSRPFGRIGVEPGLAGPCPGVERELAGGRGGTATSLRALADIRTETKPSGGVRPRRKRPTLLRANLSHRRPPSAPNAQMRRRTSAPKALREPARAQPRSGPRAGATDCSFLVESMGTARPSGGRSATRLRPLRGSHPWTPECAPCRRSSSERPPYALRSDVRRHRPRRFPIYDDRRPVGLWHLDVVKNAARGCRMPDHLGGTQRWNQPEAEGNANYEPHPSRWIHISSATPRLAAKASIGVW